MLTAAPRFRRKRRCKCRLPLRPLREKAILENPQIFQNCEIINILSAEYAQSNAEGISNRPRGAQRLFFLHRNVLLIMVY